LRWESPLYFLYKKNLFLFLFCFISRRQSSNVFWMVWISMRINNGRPVREKRFKIDENFSEMSCWNDALKLQCHSSSLNNIFNKKVLIEDKKTFHPKILSLFVQGRLSGFSIGHVFEIKSCFDFPSSLRMPLIKNFSSKFPFFRWRKSQKALI